jgi:iron(III) transport system permease protein
VAALWVAAATASEMTATDLFGVRTFAEQVYVTLAGGDTTTEGLVGVTPFIITMMALVLAAVTLLGRATPPDLPVGVRSRPTMPLGPLRTLLSLAVALVMLVLVGVPLGSLIYKAGIEVVKVDAEVVRQWSAAKLVERVFGSRALFWRELPTGLEPGVFVRFGKQMRWSLQLGALSATAAAVLGLLLAWWLRETGRRTLPTLAVLAASLAMPGPLVALCLIALLNRPELPWLVTLYDQTLLAPWLALVIRTLPWTTLLLWFALRSVPQDVLDAAAVDGARPVTRLLWIVLPLRAGAVALAWLVAFVLAAGDMSFTIIVLPPGVETLAVRMLRLIHEAADNEVAAVCLVILAALSGITAVAAWLLGALPRQRSRQLSPPQRR